MIYKDFLALYNTEAQSVNNVLRVLCAVGLTNKEVKDKVTSCGFSYTEVKDGAITKKSLEKLYNYVKENTRVFSVVDDAKVAVVKVSYTFINGTKVFYYTKDNNVHAIYTALFGTEKSQAVNMDTYYSDESCKLAYENAKDVEAKIASDKETKRAYNKKASIYKNGLLLQDGLI